MSERETGLFLNTLLVRRNRQKEEMNLFLREAGPTTQQGELDKVHHTSRNPKGSQKSLSNDMRLEIYSSKAHFFSSPRENSVSETNKIRSLFLVAVDDDLCQSGAC
jgi:hypothetical protein